MGEFLTILEICVEKYFTTSIHSPFQGVKLLRQKRGPDWVKYPVCMSVKTSDFQFPHGHSTVTFHSLRFFLLSTMKTFYTYICMYAYVCEVCVCVCLSVYVCMCVG